MTFGEILKELENGKVVHRLSYRSELVIFKQIPATIYPDNVLKLQSMPSDMKLFLLHNGFEIKYTNQYILYDALEECATSAVFDGDDFTATDWEVVDVLNYYPDEE